MITELEATPSGVEEPASDAVSAAARAGLLRPRKSLPPWLFYDARGSALFEEITELPEYYVTRTERAILIHHAQAMVAAAGPPLEVVELGAGSAAKTEVLLEALLEHQPRVTYRPLDVSSAALDSARVRLRRLRRVTVQPILARYPEGLDLPRPPEGQRRLVLFLGSNIGNYDPPAARALLTAVARALRPGDALLLGADLRKPSRVLLPAYADAQGVTAQFNKNVLARLNRQLGADFDLGAFRHVAVWNGRRSRVEMHLESTRLQRVTIRALATEVIFSRGERIHTESSYKLTPVAVRQLLGRAGFRVEASWHDARRWFGLTLGRRVAP
ncbi:MAG TPA: L-histidine N(alpha)-methyltransferase [Polyangia bacterium]|jgi:dimethylhistidine N-methyltransferase